MNKKHSGRTCKDTAWSGLLFLCILFFCFAEIAAAQTGHTFKGRVIENDAYHTPLYGATIYFPDLETGTTTNLSGYFTLENLPEGEYRLRVSFVGYQTQELTLQIPSDEEPVFALDMDSRLLGVLEVLDVEYATDHMDQAWLSHRQDST